MCGVSLCMSAVSSNESNHHLCFSLRRRAQHRGGKNRTSLKISCFGSCCFATWWPKSIESTKHKSVPAKCPLKGWKHKHLVGGCRWVTLAEKCVVEVDLIRRRGPLECDIIETLFMQRPSVNGPTVKTTFQMNVYSHFLTKLGGILSCENSNVMSLLNSTDLK